jgi:hypothetical protein
MSTPAAPSPQAAKVTTDTKLARLFGLQGESWLRHANPVSVWTRFAVLPLLALSIWSRDWIGWWSLVPIALSLVFMVVNPLLFPKPASTRNWAPGGCSASASGPTATPSSSPTSSGTRGWPT